MKTAGKILCIFLAIALTLLLLPVTLGAENGEFSYERYDGNSKIRILQYLGSGGEVQIPETLEGLPVKEIADSAFEGNDTVTSVTMGDDVVLIGAFAFRNCTALQQIRLSENLKSIGRECFKGCASLEEIVIPDSVLRLELHVNAGLSQGGMFEGCGKLKKAVIGDGVTYIPLYAFKDCFSLEEVSIGKNVEQILYYAFENCTALRTVDLPDSLITIEVGAFKSCTGLHEVHFGGSLKTLASEAFYNCSSLTELVLPDSLEYTDNILPLRGVFEACTSLKTVQLGQRLKNIADRMFYDCSALESIAMGNAVSKLGDYSFYRCNQLRAIRLPDSVTEIGAHAFEECAALERIDFGAGLKMIHVEAFRRCTALRNIDLPNSLEELEYLEYHRGVFQECTSLKRVIIGNGIETLPERLFWGCIALEEVVIGRNVETIEDYAFWSCNSLKTAYFQGNMPTCDLQTNPSLLTDTTWYYLPDRSGFPEEAICNEDFVKITFDACGGETLLHDGSRLPTYVRYSQNGWTSEPGIPIREGYTFLGWIRENDSHGHLDFNCCKFYEDTTLYAQWEINTYRILFDPGCGELSEGGRDVTYGETVGQLPIPRAEDNEFLGWFYIAPDGTEAELLPDTAMPACDLTVYAKWSVETEGCSVLFDTTGGSFLPPVWLNSGSVLNRPADPEKEGYIFLGWYADPEHSEKFDFEETLIEADTVLYAHYKPVSQRLLPPLPPRNLEIQELSATEAKISWDETPYASGYRLYLNDVCVSEHGIPQTAFVLEALTPETEYTLWVTAVNSEGESGPTSLCFTTPEQTYTVTWDVDGLITREVYRAGEMPVYKGETQKPADEIHTYTFLGWAPELAPVTADITYTAQYEAVPITFTVTWIVDGAETTETYPIGAMPQYKGTTEKAPDQLFAYTFAGWTPELRPVTEDATYTAVYTRAVKPTSPDGRFTDVPENAWFYREVYAADGLKLMGGISATEFDPMGSMTRAMLVTVLWRMEGSPEPTASNPFADIPDGLWYTKAVIWAAENGIVNGISATEFAPNAPITREQIATILYRYTKAKGYDTGALADLSSYPDAEKISPYAEEPMAWAVAAKLISGTQEGSALYLDPQGKAIRAQVAAIIVRYVTNILA